VTPGEVWHSAGIYRAKLWTSEIRVNTFTELRRPMKHQVKRGRAAPVRHIAKELSLSPRDELSNKLFFRLFQTENVYQTAALRELGISAVQGATLGALYRDPANGMSFSALYGYLAVSRQNMDAVLKRLERAGLVERIEDKTDRRSRIVRLTPDGIAAWRDLRQRTIDFFRQGTANVSMAQISACIDVLANISRGLKATRTK
jgi:DNA-binding MarR family transcriptional regulator